jgi:uncharacterized protein YaaQ
MLRWPTWDYEVSLATATSNNGDPTSGGFLIGDGPPFPMFSNAYRAFFTGNFASVGASNPLRYGRFRFAETDAWINRVHVTTSHMDVTVSGSSPIGVTVDLIAPTNQTAKAIGKSGRVRLALRRPLGSDAWLYLTRGSEWLDYRAINANFIGADIQAMQGVEISTEPAAALEALISGGEGGQVEFKYRLPVADKEKARFLSSVAAFANTSGGTIVFGIDPDEVTVVGLTMTDVPAERDRLLNIIRTGLTESPPVDGPVEQEVDGKQVMVMVVDPGPAVPYGVIFQQNRGEHPKYFVRSGANNFPATPADIRATVAARTQSNDRAFGRFMQ